MTADPKPTSALNDASRAAWDQNAAFWDAFMGEEGAGLQRDYVMDVTERLLALHPGERVAEIACGNGVFARRMARSGARVVACDYSEQLVALAHARTTPQDGDLTFRVADATDEAQLLALGEGQFDAADCMMALMDITDIRPFFSAAARLLRPGGRLVFSLMHPCFNTPNPVMVAEQVDNEGVLETAYTLRLTRYATPATYRGLGVIGQPVPQVYFHRPLSAVLDACFAAGLVLDAFEEPVFSADEEAPRPFSWVNFREFPATIIVRAIRPIPARSAERGAP